jgi:hypothetical protein
MEIPGVIKTFPIPHDTGERFHRIHYLFIIFHRAMTGNSRYDVVCGELF